LIDFAALKHQCDLLNGYTGSKTNDNINKIWADLYPPFQGASYCAAGVSYEHKHAGKMLPAVDHPFGFTYCPNAVVFAKRNGLWDTDGHYEPGDTVLYDWTGHGVAEHTGTVIQDDGKVMLVFECNTSAEGHAGSQSNGDGCWYRHRPHGSTVMGVWKTSRYLLHHPNPAPAPVKPANHHNPFPEPKHLPVKRGDRGDDVRYVQWAVGVPVDGTYGNQTDHAVRLFQRYHKDEHGRPLVQDGQVGRLTLHALSQVVHH